MIRKLLFFFTVVAIGLGNLSMHKTTRQEFLDRYADTAVREAIKYGIPASIKLAQAILESNWGTSDLAMQAHNYFGIKCKTEWTGSTFYHPDDDRDRNGKIVPSCFRKYDAPLDSWEDHSRFLRYRHYYVDLFNLPSDDYIGWAKGLKKAGYATDPKYDTKLIHTIENFDLYKYDTPRYRQYVLDQSSSGR
jgi:flagellum-specific peptidoglycan hydrolase FlgJ